jgi:hypothetical protein
MLYINTDIPDYTATAANDAFAGTYPPSLENHFHKDRVLKRTEIPLNGMFLCGILTSPLPLSTGEGINPLNGLIPLLGGVVRSGGVVPFRPFSPSTVHPFSPSPSPPIASLHWGLEHIQSVRIAGNPQDSIRITPNEARSAIGGLCDWGFTYAPASTVVGADLRVCLYKTGRTRRCAPYGIPPLPNPSPQGEGLRSLHRFPLSCGEGQGERSIFKSSNSQIINHIRMLNYSLTQVLGKLAYHYQIINKEITNIKIYSP